MPDSSQDVSSQITYIDDWTNRLAKAYPGSNITIASATGSASDGATLVVTSDATSITFKLTPATPFTEAYDVDVTLTATLSNGDIDARHVYIGITNS